MLYLALHFVWFLVAAFAIGLVFGWLTSRDGLRTLFGGPAMLVALLWAGAAALVWLRVLNNQPAFWVETGLLYVAVYAAGCVVGSLLKGAAAVPEAALALPAPRLALPQPARALPAPGMAARAGSAVAPEPAPMPKLDGEEAIVGLRPAGYVAARGGAADDLKLIKGVGPQNEERLHALGIWHFSQIAAWTPANVEWVGAYLAFPGRIEREEWVAQAKALAGAAPAADRAEPVALSGAALEGIRPGNLLSAARSGKPDDLTLIDGVGPVVAEKLNGLGIWHFDQIAPLGGEELRYLAHHTGFPGRDVAEQWRAEARILAAGGETAHSRAEKERRGKD
jgi:predicted flap endonuclease-1-like 5' DNA nuclease